MELGATLCAPGGSGMDARDPLAPYYRSVQIGRDAYRAHRAGALLPLLDSYASPADADADADIDNGGGRGRGGRGRAGRGRSGRGRAGQACGGQAGGRGVHACPVCRHGAAAFVEGLRSIGGPEGPTDEAAAAALVHRLLPLPPPKKARREERLVLLALYLDAKIVNDGAEATPPPARPRDGSWWLLVKRPAGGLLAGQWEFPHAVVSQHAEAAPEDPGARARRAAADGVLGAMGLPPARLAARAALPQPVEHIFTHVKHTMHIECAAGAAAAEAGTGGAAAAARAAAMAAAAGGTAAAAADEGGAQWESDGRTYCWMDAAAMARVGVTSGVKKVIAAALAGAPGSGGGGGKPQRGKKRAAAAPECSQPTLSKFFGQSQEVV